MIPAIEYREAEWEHRGPWQQLVRVRNVLRPDGRYGTAEITGEPDTYFTVPARMSINGRKVAGFVSTADMWMVTTEANRRTPENPFPYNPPLFAADLSEWMVAHPGEELPERTVAVFYPRKDAS